MGKRLYVEDHEDAYTKASDHTVFTPALWRHQFNPPDLLAFPNCTIGGDSDWYTDWRYSNAESSHAVCMITDRRWYPARRRCA